MSLKSNIEFLNIPTPTSDANVSQYARIQLSAVKDANRFGAMYMGGSVFALDKLRASINNKGRTMIVATRAVSIQPNTVNVDAGENPDSDQEWIGTLSVLAAEALARMPRDNPYPVRIADALQREEAEVYVLAGVWVHPEYRRRGIGRMLVERALEMVRSPSSENEDGCVPTPSVGTDDGKGGLNLKVDGGKGKKSKIVLLRVRPNNDAAREMYEKIGFVMEADSDSELVVPDPDDDVRKGWMAVTLD